APSPTGYLHVGGARTALFHWLFARATGGTLILRIEDTDKARSTDEHTQVILDGLRWLGIPWDEGPFFQGAYADRHRADVARMLASGHAYRCFCTPELIEQQRKAAIADGLTFQYDRRCRHLTTADVEQRLSAGGPFTVRCAVPDGEVAWDDAVHGTISFQGKDLDDFIVLRTDGSAIYNMAVVSDDVAMAITHVIRGDDHISNTPKQILIYRALGEAQPIFGHVPMILGSDGKKLSKRHGATAVGDYQHQGILPSAMRNFLALLGWSPGDDLEILPEEEMIRRFTMGAIQKKPAVFDTAKLEWMNGQYLSALPADQLEAPVRTALEAMGLVPGAGALGALIDAVKERSRTVTQLAEQIAVRIDASRIVQDPKAEALRLKLGDRFGAHLTLAVEELATVAESEWNPERLIEVLKGRAEGDGIKLGDLL
ncbi:MAG: glutamate--tRNA ligase, partial [Gemmatimonadota bacterium]